MTHSIVKHFTRILLYTLFFQPHIFYAAEKKYTSTLQENVQKYTSGSDEQNTAAQKSLGANINIIEIEQDILSIQCLMNPTLNINYSAKSDKIILDFHVKSSHPAADSLRIKIKNRFLSQNPHYELQITKGKTFFNEQKQKWDLKKSFNKKYISFEEIMGGLIMNNNMVLNSSPYDPSSLKHVQLYTLLLAIDTFKTMHNFTEIQTVLNKKHADIENELQSLTYDNNNFTALCLNDIQKKSLSDFLLQNSTIDQIYPIFPKHNFSPSIRYTKEYASHGETESCCDIFKVRMAMNFDYTDKILFFEIESLKNNSICFEYLEDDKDQNITPNLLLEIFKNQPFTTLTGAYKVLDEERKPYIFDSAALKQEYIKLISVKEPSLSAITTFHWFIYAQILPLQILKTIFNKTKEHTHLIADIDTAIEERLNCIQSTTKHFFLHEEQIEELTNFLLNTIDLDTLENVFKSK